MRSVRPIFLMLSALAHGLNIPIRRFTYEPINTGYVAFGDSYAAGIGAGKTSTDGCRLGQFSHPNLLSAWASSLQPGIEYQNLPCSGAVEVDVLSNGKTGQIDEWTNPSKSDRATMSIGGNDVGFADILDGCVLRFSGNSAPDCDTAIADAYSTMNSAEFSSNLATVLRQMIDKSGLDSFKIVQTGYPTFFNDQTDFCDLSTLNFFAPGHHDTNRGDDWNYLVQPLRTKLNTLVNDLNTKIKSIIASVNNDFPGKVVFADPNPNFDGHRFCEDGVAEPDPGNQDNWFFLASWPDNSFEGSGSAIFANISESVQRLAYMEQPLTVPDAATCTNSNDWADRTVCGMAKSGVIVQDDSGKWNYAPTVKLPDGTEISISDIKWLYPTAYAKTFHPRSRGQLAYREAVRGVW